MTSILGIDADQGRQATLAPLFAASGVSYRFVSERAKVLATLAQFTSDAVLYFGEPEAPATFAFLESLALGGTARPPAIILACEDPSAGAWLKAFRTGVVGLVAAYPVGEQLVLEVRQCADGLARRTGIHRATSSGEEIAKFLALAKATRRSGMLAIYPNTPLAIQATLVSGRIERVLGIRDGVEPLDAIAVINSAPWSFREDSPGAVQGKGLVFDADPTSDLSSEAIPATPIPIAGKSTATAPQFSVDIKRTRPRLLLVDDNEAILTMFGTLFEKRGFAVSTARDGREGTALVHDNAFDLIFADLNMPHLDGWGMLRLVRDDIRTREIPFAFLSAHDDYRESLRALDAGAQAYVPKGTRLDAVVEEAMTLLAPREDAAKRLLAQEGTVSVAIHKVGPQWLLRLLASRKANATITARDGWATYTLSVENGACVRASAVAGKFSAHEMRAFNAFIATLGAEGDVLLGPPAVGPPDFDQPIEDLLEKACTTLNQNEAMAREALMISATQVQVNKDLYDVYRQVGPKQWLECARLICDQRLSPREVIARLNVSPIEIENTIRDLVRRGVVTLKP